MTIGTYCPVWKEPVLPTHKKCYYRVIAQEVPAYKGTPICINPGRSGFRCCKEQDFSVRIAADISQELPDSEVDMGAPIPQIQRLREPVVTLTAEIDELSAQLRANQESIRNYNDSVARWQQNNVGDPPGVYRNNTREGAGMGFVPPRPPLNPPRTEEESESVLESWKKRNNNKHCDQFAANEHGNCKNLQWCFKVFGIELQCQAVERRVEHKVGEHRKLEVL
jgi:hypothetical protein